MERSYASVREDHLGEFDWRISRTHATFYARKKWTASSGPGAWYREIYEIGSSSRMRNDKLKRSPDP